jgi:hypothetical protein
MPEGAHPLNVILFILCSSIVSSHYSAICLLIPEMTPTRAESRQSAQSPPTAGSIPSEVRSQRIAYQNRDCGGHIERPVGPAPTSTNASRPRCKRGSLPARRIHRRRLQLQEHDRSRLRRGQPAGICSKPLQLALTRPPKPGRSVCFQRPLQPVCRCAGDAHFAGHQVCRDPVHHLRETAFAPERTQEVGFQHRP